MKTPSLVVAVLVLLFSSVILVFAADPSPSPIPLIVTFPGVSETTAAKPSEYISIIYRFALIFGALLAMAVIVFGAIEYTLTAGNVGKQEDAKDRIRNAVLGLILLLSTFFILYTINPKILDLVEPEVSSRDLPPPPPAGVQPAAPTNLQVWYNDPAKYSEALFAPYRTIGPSPFPNFNISQVAYYVFKWLWTDPRCNVGGATNISLDHYDLQRFVGIDEGTGREHYSSVFKVNRHGRCPEPAGTVAEEWLILFASVDNNDRFSDSGGNDINDLPIDKKWGVNAVSTQYVYSPGSNIVLNPIGKPATPRMLREDRPFVRFGDNSNNEVEFLLFATTQTVAKNHLNLDHSAWESLNNGNRIVPDSILQDHDYRNTGAHRYAVPDYIARGESSNPYVSPPKPAYTYLRIVAKNGAGISDPDPNREDIIDIRPWYAARLRVAGGAGGRVTSQVSGLIDCPATCTADLRVDETIELDAAPDAGFQFVGWNGCDDVQATFTCIKTMRGGGSEEVVLPSFAPL